MPRVLRILNRLIIGGPSKNAVYLTRYMQPDFDTMLVIGGKEDHEQDADFLATANNIQPTCIPQMKRSISPGNDWAAYNKLKKLIKEFKPDIVHTHAAKSGALGRLAAKHSNVPVIVHTFHGHIFHSYFNSLKTNLFIRAERYLGSISDAIIAISDVQKKELSGDFKIAVAEKFRVIPLGLDLDNFAIDRSAKRNKFRSEFGLEDETVAIGIIGRLVPVKNHSLFLTAVKYVLNNSTVKVKAFIIGDGESRVSIEKFASTLDIKFSQHTDKEHPHPLVFTSWRTDIDTICAGLDIIALTSLNEGTPVSLIEAQAAGKPIVSTRVGGIADVVLENKTALLSDITDEKAFCNNLLKLVNDISMREKFSHAGQEYVLNRFGYQRLVADMSNLYRDLLDKKNHRGKQ
jgi:glycosyltransferase involved in cell wall biosynthesis